MLEPLYRQISRGNNSAHGSVDMVMMNREIFDLHCNNKQKFQVVIPKAQQRIQVLLNPFNGPLGKVFSIINHLART